MKTTPYDKLEEVQDAIAKCMKCGNCMAVCPVYLTEKHEAAYARGKLSIAEAILKGELDLKDEDVQEKLFNCLVCTSCMQNCPCGVDVCKIMLSLRAALARETGLHPVKKIIFVALKNQPIFDKAMKAGAALQWMGLRKLPGNAGYEPRFTMGLAMKRIFPGLATAPFRDQMPELIKAENRKMKVSFFTGCAFNYIFPDVARDVVEVLKENDVEIAIRRSSNAVVLPSSPTVISKPLENWPERTSMSWRKQAPIILSRPAGPAANPGSMVSGNSFQKTPSMAPRPISGKAGLMTSPLS